MNRRVVEQMLLSYFPNIARIPSNSNNFKLASSRWKSLFRVGSLAQRIGLRALIPGSFRDDPLRFDIQATRVAGKDAAYPLLESDGRANPITGFLGGQPTYERLFREAICGSEQSYERLVAPQAIALNFAASPR